MARRSSVMWTARITIANEVSVESEKMGLNRAVTERA
jgi:hypothetical protein